MLSPWINRELVKAKTQPQRLSIIVQVTSHTNHQFFFRVPIGPIVWRWPPVKWTTHFTFHLTMVPDFRCTVSILHTCGTRPLIKTEQGFIDLLFLFQVSWIRHRDIHILTVGLYTYTSDQRFQSNYHPQTDEWILQIKWAQKRDSGIYECQISTQPVRSLFITLEVVGEC